MFAFILVMEKKKKKKKHIVTQLPDALCHMDYLPECSRSKHG